MPRPCLICSHPECDDIEANILSFATYRNISKHWSMSIAAISRHVNRHMRPMLERRDRSRDESRRSLIAKIHSGILEAHTRMNAAEDKATKLDWFKAEQSQLE
ncbi:MAG: hypothetical protein ACE5FA_07100, partial [Dehalococcoidia bacterium]